MINHRLSTGRWNLFARELEDILEARGLRLTHLDDRAAIHREKVRRLTRSLLSPKSFPVLNTDEMTRVEEAFNLSEDELLRLRAAILVTAIEETLMDRINQDDALLAAEQIFPIIVAAMRKQRHGEKGISVIRNDKSDMLEETELDMALDNVFETIDRATKALYMSIANAQSERVRYAREARAGFEAALSELDEIEDVFKATDEWQAGHADASIGILAVEKRLEELGESY
jgi:hypothetical protein